MIKPLYSEHEHRLASIGMVLLLLCVVSSYLRGCQIACVTSVSCTFIFIVAFRAPPRLLKPC